MHTLTELPEWQALIEHHQQIAHQEMKSWFNQDPSRSSHFTLKLPGITLDYSRNRMTGETLTRLLDLAKSVQLREKIRALFSGQPINSSEKRPALHIALRDIHHQKLFVNHENISLLIKETKQKIYEAVDQIHQQQWKGSTGKPITDIVNVGIGGSYLGPMMTTAALKDFALSKLKFHFISSVDPDHSKDVLTELNPETTLFIISSKTFTTIETLTNFQAVVNWMQASLGKDIFTQHFMAITAAPEKAKAFGIPSTNIFPIWEWVGGRYSIWSAIGLPLILMIGIKQFEKFLQGAYEMDQHFLTADFENNMPVLLGLLSIWYINFFNTTAQAIIPYSYRLRYLISYLQQAEMESNGKSVTIHGNSINYLTSPIIFGEEGNNGQHTYYQLLHQGTHLIPIDFILTDSQFHSENRQKAMVVASALSQAEALVRGISDKQTYQDLLTKGVSPDEAKTLAPHQMIPGNKPCNIIFLEQLTPYTLGKLLALYEHKIYVEGCIWNINSFDQWGVELGKKLLPGILDKLSNQYK